jgi:hypothetical protein
MGGHDPVREPDVQRNVVSGQLLSGAGWLRHGEQRDLDMRERHPDRSDLMHLAEPDVQRNVVSGQLLSGAGWLRHRGERDVDLR